MSNRIRSRLSAAALAAILVLLPACSRQDPLPDESVTLEGKTYSLSFIDEFDGTKLNKKFWNRCPEWERSNVGGYWDDDCSYLDGDGHLVLRAMLDEDGVPRSGAIRSRDLFEQCGGYFEARCRVQKAHGLWTAFWLMCPEQHLVGNGASDGAEIDIYESYSIDDGMINHAIHYDNYYEDHKCWSRATKAPECYDGEYHTYGLLWTDDAYIFYIDGKEVRRLDSTSSEYPGCCQAETYLKFSVEFGTWGGTIDPSELPDDALTVDWVRVYQLSDH